MQFYLVRISIILSQQKLLDAYEEQNVEAYTDAVSKQPAVCCS